MANYNPLQSQAIFDNELVKLGLTRTTWSKMPEFKKYAKQKYYGAGPAFTPVQRSSNILSPQQMASVIQGEKTKPGYFAPQLAPSITTKFKIRDRVSPNIATPKGMELGGQGVPVTTNNDSAVIGQTLSQVAGIGSLAAGAAASTGVTAGMAAAGAASTAVGGGITGAVVGTSVGSAAAAGTATAAAGGAGAATMGLAAALGPIAIAAFAVMAIASINSAKAARRAARKAQERERDIFKTKVAMYQNREQLENLVLNDTLNQVERQATKSRAALNVAKGETLSGATYNVLQMAHRRNELEYKERLKSRNIQKRIAMREQLVVDYHATRVKMESIADQAPSNADIALGIIQSGLSTAMNYYSAVGDPNAPQTA